MSEQPELQPAAVPDYWSETRRPLSSLAFLTPILLAYEAGVFWIGGLHADAVRNGADSWMRSWLQQVGFAHICLLPVLLVAVLLGWHLAAKQPWRVSGELLAGMFAESLLFAFALILLGQLNDLCFRNWLPTPLQVVRVEFSNAGLVRTVSFLGAGIYEESLFRLALLPACYGLGRMLFLPARLAAGSAILLTSLAFALAHYLGPLGDQSPIALLAEAIVKIHATPAHWQSFAFRTIAGLYFAALFVCRGFGITVGCHAAYDVLVGVLMTSEL